MKRSRERLFAVIVSTFSLGAVLAACEVGFRIALFSEWLEVPSLRQAWRFADGNYEDDYWKLVYLFRNDTVGSAAGVFDAELGWLPERSTGNPLAITTNEPYELQEFMDGPILFYGDSFVAGITPMQDRIPQILDRLFVEKRVLNLGVSGYGVDQIYLRALDSISAFENPTVLVGILTRDLDRSILKIRGGQKPYFEIANGKLSLRNSPIQTTLEQYIDRYPPSIKSYFWRFIIFRLRNVVPEDLFNGILNYDEKHRQKMEINNAILRQLGVLGKDMHVPIFCVIFYNWEDLHTSGWREKFLKSTLGDLGLKYFDTKPILLEYMSRTSLSPYDSDDGHLNAEGNRLVAERLKSWLETDHPYAISNDGDFN